jgi:Transposase DDE domain
MGMVESLLKLAGLSWTVPDYSTVCRRQKKLKVRIPYRPAAQGLHLLVDSTGLKMMGEGEWKRKKHGAEYRRQWRKLHIEIGGRTLEIRAIEITPNSVGDAPMLPSLLGKIDTHEALLSVTGDGAYDTKACHEAIALREGKAIIPVRKNARPWKENRTGANVRNEILRATERLGRTIWKRWSGYHRRSLVETKMRCVKLMGERVMAQSFDRQVAELQVRAAILNCFTQLGTHRDGAHGINPSGVRGRTPRTRFLQQSRCKRPRMTG